MAGPNRKTRLTPPLMYAFRAAHDAKDARKKLDLRDEESGERIISGRRGPTRAAITEPLLRRELAQDLTILMNTVNLDSSEELGDFDHVRKSILNFGLPDIVHRSLDEGSVDDITDEIETALTSYEPRLVANTIHVSRDYEAGTDGADLKLRFMVRAEMFCDPLNVPVEFIADVELDTGKISVNRL